MSGNTVSLRLATSLLSGALNAAGLQTALAVADNAAGFRFMIDQKKTMLTLARSSAAMTAMAGSALAMTYIALSEIAMGAIWASSVAIGAMFATYNQNSATTLMGSALARSLWTPPTYGLIGAVPGAIQALDLSPAAIQTMGGGDQPLGMYVPLASTMTYSSGTVVSNWADVSGRGNTLFQATVGNRPSQSGAAMNGYTPVNFVKASQHVLLTSFAQARAFSFYVVHRAKAGRTATPGGILSWNTNTTYIRDSGTLGQVQMNDAATSAGIGGGVTNVADGTHYLLHYHFSNLAPSPNGVAYANNVSMGTMATNYNTGGVMQLGTDQGGGFLDGDIAEIICMPNNLYNTTADANILQMLNAKYALGMTGLRTF